MSELSHRAVSALHGKRVGIAALMLSVGILVSRVLGYVREAVIAYQQGAGVATDAYNAAFLLPDLMNYFLAGGTLSITFIPLFGACLAQDRESVGWKLFSTIATVMGGVLLAGIVVAEVFTEYFIHLLFPDFGPAATQLTVEMTRIVLPCQFFHYIGGLILATLMAQGRFAAATLAPLVYNGSIIFFGLLLGSSMGMAGFAVGALIGAVIGPFGLSLYLARDRLQYRPHFAWREVEFRRYVLLTIPLMLGVSLVTLDEWFGRILGSAMETGTISWLNYGRRLMLVPIAVIGQAASQAALPFLSRLAGEGKRDELAMMLTRSLHYVILLALTAGGLMVALAEPTVTLVYQRGAFTALDSARATAVLELFALGIASWGVQMVAARGFYAEQNTLTPMALSTVVTLGSVPLYMTLGDRMGASGLALAATIGITTQALVTVLAYKRSNRAMSLRSLLDSTLRGLVIAGGGSLVAALMCRWMLLLPSWGVSLDALLRVTVGGVLGGAVAAGLARVLVPSDWARLSSRVRAKLVRKRGR